MTSEPSPIRDNGPYTSPGHALQAFDAVAYGIPGVHVSAAAVAHMQLSSALAGTNVELSDWERGRLLDVVARLRVVEVQMLTGWIVRAHLAGTTTTPPPTSDYDRGR